MTASVEFANEHAGTPPPSTRHAHARRTLRLEVPMSRLSDLASFLPAELRGRTPEILASVQREQTRLNTGGPHQRNPFLIGRQVRLITEQPGGAGDKHGPRLHRGLSVGDIFNIIVAAGVIVFIIVAVVAG